MRRQVADAIFTARKNDHRHHADAQRVARGKGARKEARRSTHAALDLHGRPDPIALLEEQERSRLAELVPLRHERMQESPFAFFRGAALIMASDLARTPNSGIHAQLCGDAHLVNFGMFGTPERSLIFDINDFDETLRGPWEWDLKRLAASLEIAGRNNGYSKRERRSIVVDTVRCYRETMVELAAMRNLEVWYARLPVEMLTTGFSDRLTQRQLKAVTKLAAKAERRDNAHALDRLTEGADGARHIISDPPLIVPVGELLGETDLATFKGAIEGVVREYGRSLPDDRRVLFDQYRMVEVARKVVGVGSVGTRCWIALFVGVDDDDPLFLQIKEAGASVLERFAGTSPYQNHGERVVSGQRLMQASSDILLGWVRVAGFDGAQRDFYIRQLHDWKGSFPVEQMRAEGMSMYGRMCGWTLARAHARSGDRVAIASYLGNTDVFDQALAAFARAYADQNEQDYEALLEAIRSGRLSAETGV